MNAAFILQTGPADVIQVGDLPMPTPSNTEVLVRVGAVAVNPIDTYVRSGLVAMKLPKPFILGSDLAGTVVDVAADVRHFRKGDRVWGSNQGLLGRQGTFAEYVAVDQQWLYPTPHNVSDDHAAASALVGITAHLGLFQHAQLKPGETIFVNGGSGGVGAMVIQMARAIGARVITCAGDDAKADHCRSLGAAHAFNYRNGKLEAEIKQVAPEGVHVWWETTRDPDFDLAVSVMANRGRMVLMAGREARPAFPVGPFYVKCCSMHGFVMFLAAPDEQRQCAADISAWLASGSIKPNIDRVLPLSETACAHRLQEESTIHRSGVLKGKLVLRP